MPMFCPMCGGPARFIDIQSETQSIRCRFCQAEYSAAHLLNEQGQREDPRDRRHREIRLPQPKGVTIREDGLDLLITHKWPVLSAIPAFIFGIIWTCISSTFLLIPASDWEGGEAPPFWFIGLFLSVGVIVLLTGVYMLFNSTTYRINRQRLVVKHHPLPWPGETFDLDGVEQLYVKQHINRSSKSTSITYSLNKVTRDGRHTQIQSGLQPEVALYIEQEIERLLRIKNVPVQGEYGKGGWAEF